MTTSHGSRRLATHVDLDVPEPVAQFIQNTLDPTRQTKWHRFDHETIEQCLPILREQMQHQGYAIPATFP